MVSDTIFFIIKNYLAFYLFSFLVILYKINFIYSLWIQSVNKLFVCSGGEYSTAGIIVYFFNLSESICMSSIIQRFYLSCILRIIQIIQNPNISHIFKILFRGSAGDSLRGASKCSEIGRGIFDGDYSLGF